MDSFTKQFDEISLVITSCGRADLLATTLNSMTPWLKCIKEKILIEDSGRSQPNIRQLTEQFGFLYLENERQLGQHQSIDRAYQEITNPYIFHCEDDWQFFQQPDFNQAKALLNQVNISCVCFRKIDDRSRSKYPEQTLDVARYRSAEINRRSYLFIPKDYHPEYGSFTFNPNLIKKELYDRFGPYAQYQSERKISARLKLHNYVIAFETAGACQHIGWNRHAQDPTKLPRGYTLSDKAKRSYLKRIRKLKSWLHPTQ